MNDVKVAFKDALKPGLIISLITVAISTLINILISDIELVKNLGWLIWIAIAAMFFIYTKNYGKVFPVSFTYGKAFVFMLYMTIILSVAYGIYSYIYFGFIDPGYTDKIMQISEEKMLENPQLTDEQISAALEMQKKFMTPVFMAITSLFSTAFFSTIISLLVAIFTKNEKQTEFTLD